MPTDFNPFLAHFEKEVLPQIMQSNCVITILTDSLDSKICLEVGAAVLLNIPIIICTRDRSLVSSALEKVATRITLMPKDWSPEEAQDAIHGVVKDILGLKE